MEGVCQVIPGNYGNWISQPEQESTISSAIEANPEDVIGIVLHTLLILGIGICIRILRCFINCLCTLFLIVYISLKFIVMCCENRCLTTVPSAILRV